MTDLLSTIARELGPQALGQIGASVGASPQQTQSAIAAALPAIVAGLAKNTSSPQGAQALASALDKNHGPSLMDSLGPIAGALLGGQQQSGGGGLGGMLGAALSGGQLSGGQGGASTGGLGALIGALAGGPAAPVATPKALDGAGILGHVLGDQQGMVAQKVSQVSGLDPATVSRLLPALAPIVMSALGTLKADKKLDAGGVASLVQGEHQKLAKGAPAAQGPAGIDLAGIGGALLQSGVLSQLFK
jgi:hypothetical protein